jgi:hypothetical protein
VTLHAAVSDILAWLQDIFKYLDILLFVEATIYQMDEENEALCEALTQPGGSSSGDGHAQHSFQGLPPSQGRWRFYSAAAHACAQMKAPTAAHTAAVEDCILVGGVEAGQLQQDACLHQRVHHEHCCKVA